jgi:hypothetical protein
MTGCIPAKSKVLSADATVQIHATRAPERRSSVGRSTIELSGTIVSS